MTLSGACNSHMQHHIKCMPSDISRYVFVCGSPDRSRKLASRLAHVRLVTDSRGYMVFTGQADGIPMTVCYTGMGSPSLAIAVEELGNLGGDTFLRVGSAGGMQENIDVGDVVIATGTVRDDGTSIKYLPAGFPAIPSFDVTCALVEAARSLGIPVHVGIVSAGDAFYAPKDDHRLFERLVKAGVKAGEMESGALFIVCSYRGWRAGALFAIDGNILKGRIKPPGTESLFAVGEDKEIDIAIEAMKIIARKDNKITGGNGK